MKIALLGFGNIGRPTFEIIKNKQGTFFKENDIEIKYVLIKSLDEAPYEAPFFVTNFEVIETDPEVSLVIEMMGARVSYAFIKRAILAHKSIITANKEVMAAHFSELNELAKENNVKLFYEASVGGGIPIISTFTSNNGVNNIYRIEGILNGTTNFMLTSMHKEKLSFDDALVLAQRKGFAEADPTADLEGLDMVRKIAILSDIAYHTDCDIEACYHFGITKLTKEFIDVVELMGYTLKFMASSELKNNKISMEVEPVIIKNGDLVSNVDYEYNVIRYYGDHSGTQMAYGKGAGPMTANALVNDLVLLIKGYNPYVKKEFDYEVVGNKASSAKYLLELKSAIPDNFVERNLNGYVITNQISGSKLLELMPKITFYAKIL